MGCIAAKNRTIDELEIEMEYLHTKIAANEKNMKKVNLENEVKILKKNLEMLAKNSEKMNKDMEKMNKDMEEMADENELLKLKIEMLEDMQNEILRPNMDWSNEDNSDTKMVYGSSFKMSWTEDSIAAHISILETWINIPGLHHLTSNILRYLDTKSLANCRLLSKSFKILIDNDRSMLSKQITQVMNQQFYFDEMGGSTISEKRPEWQAVITSFQKNENSDCLKELLLALKSFSQDGYSTFGGLLSTSRSYLTQSILDPEALLLRSSYIPTEADVHFVFRHLDFHQWEKFVYYVYLKTMKLNINQKIMSRPLLHHAIEGEDGLAKVQLMLEKAEELELEIFATDYKRRNAVHLAKERNKLEIFCLLRNHPQY